MELKGEKMRNSTFAILRSLTIYFDVTHVCLYLLMTVGKSGICTRNGNYSRYKRKGNLIFM